MKVKVFSIRDDKAAAYMPPFYFQNDGQALRAFMDLVKDPNSNCHRHPGDFRLYRLGYFEDESGKLESCQPHYLGCAADFMTEVFGVAGKAGSNGVKVVAQ